MFSRATAAVLVLCASLLGATPANADPVWSPPITLSDTSVFSSSPRIVAFGSGLAAIFNTGFGSTDGFAATISSDGATWSTPVRISTGTLSAEDADLIAYPGGLAAVWDAYTGSAWIPQVATSVDGITWSTPVTLSDPGDDGLGVRISAFSGGLAVSWISNSGVPGVRVSSSATGAVWSAQTTISTPGRNPNDASISSFAGGVAVGWSERDGSSNWSNVSVSATGATWTTTTLMTSPSNNAVKVASTAAGLVAVWSYFDGIGKLGSAGSADGITWATSTLASGPTSSFDASLGAYGSRVAAVFTTDSSGIAQVQFATTVDGLSWSSPVELSAGAQNAERPTVVAFAGGYAVVWLEQDHHTHQSSVLVSTSADGASWTAPLALSAAGERAGSPTLASVNGGIAAAWFSRGGGADHVDLSIAPIAVSAAAGLAATGREAQPTLLLAAGLLAAGLLAAAALLAAQRAQRRRSGSVPRRDA